MDNVYKIPIIEDINIIDETIFEDFMNKGVAYVKIPQDIKIDIEIITNKGLEFFKSNESKKEIYLFDKHTLLGYNDYPYDLHKSVKNFNLLIESNNYEKYLANSPVDEDLNTLNHIIPTINNEKVDEISTVPNSIQTLDYFREHKKSFLKVTEVFKNNIGKKILKKIFNKFDKNKEFVNFFSHLNQDFLIYSYYPKTNVKIGFECHEDYHYLTILHIQKPGLEFLINNKWVQAEIRLGYVLVNLSTALSYSLGRSFDAVKHQVVAPKEERISFGIFLLPKLDDPLIDILNNKKLFEKYYDFIQFMFNKQ